MLLLISKNEQLLPKGASDHERCDSLFGYCEVQISALGEYLQVQEQLDVLGVDPSHDFFLV
jgi:hypothetical protein